MPVVHACGGCRTHKLGFSQSGQVCSGGEPIIPASDGKHFCSLKVLLFWAPVAGKVDAPIGIKNNIDCEIKLI